MLPKEKALKEMHSKYFELFLNKNFPIGKMEDFFAENFMGFGTVKDEIMDFADTQSQILRQRQQSEGIETSYFSKPIFHNVTANGNVAFFADEIFLTMKIDNNEVEIYNRNTIVLEYMNNRWLLIHAHASAPVAAETEKDTFGIDEWKQKNEELQKLVDERTKELRTSLENLKVTQAQLIQSEKLASLGELTAGIAHEIQNPLNFVNNFAEVSAEMLDEMHEELEKGDTTEAIAIATDLKTNLEKINHHGQRASFIVKGMLEHSRVSTGVKEPTDLNALANEYLRLAYHGLRAKDNNFNAEMETHFDPNLPKVSVIPQDIGRVLLNLINNAFYAVQQRAVETLHATSLQYQPTVTVSTKRLENAIEIRVKDNGNGISEAIKDKIFQPFFTTKPTGQGTGLGLSLTYDIVTKGHGGTLELTSTEGLGSTLIIRLPS